MPVADTTQFLLLNPNSSFLECQNLKQMKKCQIPASHFARKESDNFYLHYSYNERIIKKYYGLPPIKVILPNSFIEIPIDEKDNDKYIYYGDNGFFYFKTNYTDNVNNIFDVSDIEEKTTFITTFRFYMDILSFKSYIKCRLWKPINEKLWLFCKLNESLSSYANPIKMKDAAFHYKKHTVAVVFYYSDNYYFQIKKLNTLVPFLYSDKQIINIIEEKDSYDLKFHIEAYNGQPLRLSLDKNKNIILQYCNENGKDLICTIKKEKFYEMCTNSTQKLKLYVCDFSLKDIEYNPIHDIIIDFNKIEKKIYLLK